MKVCGASSQHVMGCREPHNHCCRHAQRYMWPGVTAGLVWLRRDGKVVMAPTQNAAPSAVAACRQVAAEGFGHFTWRQALQDSPSNRLPDWEGKLSVHQDLAPCQTRRGNECWGPNQACCQHTLPAAAGGAPGQAYVSISTRHGPVSLNCCPYSGMV